MNFTDDLSQYDRFIYDELTPARNERGKYLCPLCGSGTRANGTAALSVKQREDGRLRFTCFSCNEQGDIFDLYAKREGISLQDATRAVIAKYGRPGAPTQAYAQPVSVNRQPAPSPDEAHRAKIRKHVADCHAAIMDSKGYAYLKRRGINDQSIQRFRLGYNAQRNRLVIPHDPAGSYYIERDLSGNHDAPKYMNPEGVEGILFNADALYADAPCFIVESDLCAISIEQEGGKAVALAGLGGQGRLLSQIRRREPTAPALIVSLDNDAKGQEAASKLVAELGKMGLSVLQANISGREKDPNEALQADREAFRDRIAAIIHDVTDRKEAESRLQQQIKEQARDKYLAGNASGLIDAFIDGIQAAAATPATPTGFPGLDKRLDGGLYEGLYIIGAVSSLGKTTFVHQMADQIARSGHDILYFSLEMGRFELMAKSISRLTYAISKGKNGTTSLAKTTRGILAGKKWEGYTAEELSVIEEAVNAYGAECAPRIWIEEGIGNIGVADIRSKVEDHVKHTGHRPVVIIDYLQILAPADPRASDKQNTDKNVLELKRLSRDMKIPIVGISSLNRENYTAPINMTAFKESGSLEYGSDVLIGLQYEGMDYREAESDKDRDKRIRVLRKDCDEKAARGEAVRIELKLLKNRNGSKGDPIPFLFTPMFNHFSEATALFTPAGDVVTPWDVFNGRKTPQRRR